MKEKTAENIALAASLTVLGIVFIALPFKSLKLSAPPAKKAADVTFEAVKKWLS